MTFYLKDISGWNEIKNHLLDLDGVFSFLTNEFKEHCFRVLVETVMEIGPPKKNGKTLSFEEAMVTAKRSHAEYGSCFTAFQIDYGICSETFNEIYPPRIDYELAGPCHITPRQLRDFSEMAEGVAIFSHSRPHWIWHMLETFCLREEVLRLGIPVISRKDVGNLLKTQPEAFRAVFEKLGWNAAETAVIEDSPVNLKAAKNAQNSNRGSPKTVYIHHGKPFDSAERSYVDAAMKTLRDYFKFSGFLRRNAECAMRPTSSSFLSRFSPSGRGCPPAVR